MLGRRFVWMTDHCGLKYLFDQLRLNAIQARWMALINEFDFKIKHIKGKENPVANALSRSVQTIHLAAVNVGEYDIKQIIIILLQSDEHVNLAKEILQQEANVKKYEEYQLTTDELSLYNKLYVLESP